MVLSRNVALERIIGMAEFSFRLVVALVLGVLLAIPAALGAYVYGLVKGQSASEALVLAGKVAAAVVDQLLSVV